VPVRDLILITSLFYYKRPGVRFAGWQIF